MRRGKNRCDVARVSVTGVILAISSVKGIDLFLSDVILYTY